MNKSFFLLHHKFKASQKRCVFNDNSKIIGCQFSIKSHVVGAH